jgi:hypothetical protein
MCHLIGEEVGNEHQTDSHTWPHRQALSVSDGVWMYQTTGKGLALEITARAPSTAKTAISTEAALAISYAGGHASRRDNPFLAPQPCVILILKSIYGARSSA